MLSNLELCIKNTYFLFQGMYYEHVHGEPMVSTMSPIVVNLFMKEFETKAINSAANSLKTVEKVC